MQKVGNDLKNFDYKSSRDFESRTSELCKNVSVEKFELIFKDFMRQADDNAKTGKSFGGKKPKYLDNCFFDGADLGYHYGQGAAAKTPYLNWWVLSIYYLPENGKIIMGIENIGANESRYPYISQMKPITYKYVGNKKYKVAVFYETTKETIDCGELYDNFIDIAEQIMRLGVCDYTTKTVKTEVTSGKEKKKHRIIEKSNYDVSKDSEYVELANKIILTEDVKYVPRPEKPPEKIKTGTGEKYKRDPKQGAEALKRADYNCELCNRNPEEISFHRASDDNYYMEAHHIVPMANQG
ncbi:MAG: hypothetical protein K5756_06780 [Clostridiales bacterium]|nr:hypothetical protein [Clostridiales bacterium]